ncbi:Hsp70 family protein, partial [Streptomyces mirabilis]|uniref:Hsp70 family protein n=2 Tax=Streptomyces TaxID=1883 RepID=UPI003426D394
PQIEVAFDIDANGIMHVSAKDLATGREQKMTVTGGSALPKNDIDRMMREAEQYAEEDRARREAAETRNQAEQLVYQTEKFLRDNEERIPSGTKPEVESAVADLKRLLEDSATDTAALRGGVENLASVSQKMGQAMYAQAQQTPREEPAAEHTTAAEEGVVDAEIVDDERETRGGAA